MSSLRLTPEQKAHLHDDRGHSQNAILTALGLLATVAVILRLTSKRLLRKPLAADDFTIIFALVANWGLIVIGYFNRHHGWGKHAAAIGIPNLVACLKLAYAFEIGACVCLTSIRVAILCLYRRLFPTRQFLRALWAVGALVITTGLVFALLFAFQCTPVRFAWDKTVPHGHCVDLKGVLVASVIPNSLLDIIVFVMPIPIVWRLNITRVQKLGISCIFLLGGFVCVASFIRLGAIVKITPAALLDPTWSLYEPGIWNHIEASLGIVTACTPILRSLLQLGRGRTVGSGSKTESGWSNKNNYSTDLSHSQPPLFSQLPLSGWTGNRGVAQESVANIPISDQDQIPLREIDPPPWSAHDDLKPGHRTSVRVVSS